MPPAQRGAPLGARPGARRAAELVRELAREPRPAGSAAESRARGFCAAQLRAAAFDVREEPFDYSAFVGRWGTPVGGTVAAALLLVASAAARSGRPGVALVLLVLGGFGLAAGALVLARSGVLSFPAGRRRGVNLVATRGGDEPALWLMAHLDSKSQPVPILLRAAGVALVGATWIVALGLAAAQLAGGPVGSPWAAVAAFALAGAVPVIATTVGARSPGALDNATGVAAVLAAAAATTASPLGVCLTSAEELGLAGARAWVRAREASGVPPRTAINCDGIDDRGATTCMYSGRRPDALVANVQAAAARAGTAVRAHRLLPGVLTDGVAFADAGWPVVTLSKGGVRTLARIHTPRDRAGLLVGEGVDEVAHVIIELIHAHA